jgi:hypothetical protein
MSRSRLFTIMLVAAVLLTTGSATAEDAGDGPVLSDKRARFALGVSWVHADFSTTFETVQKDPERRFFMSLEGDLGLPASSSVPSLQLLARVARKSYIAANLGRFDRSRTLLEIDEELHLDDLVLEVDADVDLFFNVTDVDVAYGHAYVDDERVRVIGKFGLSLLDLDIGVLAEGSYRIGDISDEGSYELSASLIVPVPLVGVLFDVDLSPRWALTSSVELFYMPVSDITAKAWRAQIHVRYAFGRTVGMILGYSTFDIEVVEDTDLAKSTIAYTMNGFSAGLVFTF